MKLSPIPLLTCMVALALPFAPIASAQQPAAESIAAAQQRRLSGPDRNIGVLDVPTPTPVGAIVESIRKETGANIILTPGAEKVVVPSLKLRNVSVRAAMTALNNAVDPKSRIVIDEVGKDLDCLITISIPQVDRSSLDIVTRAFLLPSQPDQDFDKQLDMVVDAVKTAVTLDARSRGVEHQLPLVEAHRATHLLLVSGERADVDIAAQVIGLLQGEAVSAAKSKAVSSNLMGSIEAAAQQAAAAGLEDKFAALKAAALAARGDQAAPAKNGKDKSAASIKVSVLGAVKAPGLYTMDAGSNLAHVIAQAQGFKDFANSKQLVVIAKSGAKTTVDFSNDPTSYQLQDGDVVTVKEKMINLN